MKRAAWALLAIALLGCSAYNAGATSQPAKATSSPAALAPPALVTTSPLALSSAPTPSASTGQVAFPNCDDLHELGGPADWYTHRTSSGYNPDPIEARDWASGFPGFEEVWIDRDQHPGWVSLGFSRDAADRERAVSAKYPGGSIVVVPLDHGKRELDALTNRVSAALSAAGVGGFGVSGRINYGVVEADFRYLEHHVVDVLSADFSGQPICVSGGDPALKPPEGAQPSGGPGWTLLADEDRTGQSYRTGIAWDAASYERLWTQAGLTGARPEVDFQSSVVIWFGAVHGSSCPHIRVDGVTVETDRPLVHAEIVDLDASVVCTADAIAQAYVVALDRSMLPHGPFAIQLEATDPPAGVPDERTVVNADLSAPGATTDQSHIHQGGAIP